MILALFIAAGIFIAAYDAYIDVVPSIFIAIISALILSIFTSVIGLFIPGRTIATETETKVLQEAIYDGDKVYLKYDDKVHEDLRSCVEIDPAQDPNTIVVTTDIVVPPTWTFYVVSPYSNFIKYDSTSYKVGGIYR